MQNQLHMFADVITLLSQVSGQLKSTTAGRDAADAAERLMLNVDVASITLRDDPRWIAGQFWRSTDEDDQRLIGQLLCLQALAAHPEACARMVQVAAQNLEQALLGEAASIV